MYLLVPAYLYPKLCHANARVNSLRTRLGYATAVGIGAMHMAIQSRTSKHKQAACHSQLQQVFGHMCTDDIAMLFLPLSLDR